jgi:hypothetical protein
VLHWEPRAQTVLARLVVCRATSMELFPLYV